MNRQSPFMALMTNKKFKLCFRQDFVSDGEDEFKIQVFNQFCFEIIYYKIILNRKT